MSQFARVQTDALPHSQGWSLRAMTETLHRSNTMPLARTPLLHRLACLAVALCGALGPLHTAHATQDAEPPRPSRERTVAIKVGDVERQAILVNAPAAGKTSPAVIILHGGMGSADQMRENSGFDPVARENGFMAVYAEGTEFGAVKGRHAWNTGHLLRRQVRDADDIAYLDRLIDVLVAEHGADPTRIFMTGGSNGGMMTFVYAVQRAERLAAIAPVVASMFSFDVQPQVPLPVLMINGAKDEEVPLEGGMSANALVRAAQATPFKPVREVVDFWVKANKSRPEPVTAVAGSVTTKTYAADDGGAVTEFVLDGEGGHGWPGTRARRDDNAPIAAFRGAERVWSFFAGKSRKAATAAAEVRTIEFPDLVDPARSRKVPVRVQLPASGGACPVIVISHGAGGDRDTHAGQAQDLAAHGYAVVTVEHIGSNRDRLAQQGLRMMKTIEAMTRDSEEVLGRPRDISFALDRATEWNASHAVLKGRLDLARVGMMGHSFGAYTTMVVCGMRPALDWLTPSVAPGRGLGPDLRDPRVLCGVALSPQSPGEPFFIEQSFAGLRVPLLGITGSKDDQQGGRSAAARKEAFSLWPAGEHRLIWITNARHNDFTSSSGATGRSLASPTREDVQPLVRAATRAFFDLHLKRDADAARRLTVDGLKPLLRGEIDAVEVLVKSRP